MGECEDKMATAGMAAGVPVTHAADAVAAVPVAWQLSAPGDVILLSPANASWDQFPSFEVRGDKFIAAVEALQTEPKEG